MVTIKPSIRKNKPLIFYEIGSCYFFNVNKVVIFGHMAGSMVPIHFLGTWCACGV